MKKAATKSTTQKKLDQYIADAEKRLKRGEVPSITDKTQLTTEDKIKMSLCKLFVQYLNRNNMKPSEFSKLTKIEKTRVSEIINYKVKKIQNRSTC
jgi:predicted XRE-type DNA-binding protein